VNSGLGGRYLLTRTLNLFTLPCTEVGNSEDDRNDECHAQNQKFEGGAFILDLGIGSATSLAGAVCGDVLGRNRLYVFQIIASRFFYLSACFPPLDTWPSAGKRLGSLGTGASFSKSSI
jgi:hypothetical protein